MLTDTEFEIALTDLIERERLTPAFRQTTKTIYEPIARRILARRHAAKRPVLVGLSGPQGSGKSTAVQAFRLLQRNASSPSWATRL